MIPVQGATIFGTLNVSHGATVLDGGSPSMNAAAQEINDAEQHVTQQIREQLIESVSSPFVPFVPAAPQQPAYWVIYNRWTGKYVSDASGNEDADDENAHQWPTRAAAAAFVCTSSDTAVATARKQAPPDDPPTCESCWRPQERNATTCFHCHAILDVFTGWIHIQPHATDGRNLLGTLTL